MFAFVILCGSHKTCFSPWTCFQHSTLILERLWIFELSVANFAPKSRQALSHALHESAFPSIKNSLCRIKSERNRINAVDGDSNGDIESNSEWIVDKWTAGTLRKGFLMDRLWLCEYTTMTGRFWNSSLLGVDSVDCSVLLVLTFINILVREILMVSNILLQWILFSKNHFRPRN